MGFFKLPECLLALTLASLAQGKLEHPYVRRARAFRYELFTEECKGIIGIGQMPGAINQDMNATNFLACSNGDNGRSYDLEGACKVWIDQRVFLTKLDSNMTFLDLEDPWKNTVNDHIEVAEFPPDEINNHDRQNVTIPMVGKRYVMAVIVNLADASPTINDLVLKDSIFGTSGDETTLKSIYEGCSRGSMTIEPAKNRGALSGGVLSVTIGTPLGTPENLVRNAVTDAIVAEFGVGSPHELADHVMYCYPEGVMDLASYSFANHWQSVYTDTYCMHANYQAHEIGHNLNLADAGETLYYDDYTGNMGVPTADYAKEVKTCFNAANLYQLGWYQNEYLKMIRTDAPTKITLQGFTKPQDGTIRLVKFDRRSPYDFYVNFNWPDGPNAETQDAPNMVTITGTGRHGFSYYGSTLVAKLNEGDHFVQKDYFFGPCDLSIYVESIDTVDGSAEIVVHTCFDTEKGAHQYEESKFYLKKKKSYEQALADYQAQLDAIDQAKANGSPFAPIAPFTETKPPAPPVVSAPASPIGYGDKIDPTERPTSRPTPSCFELGDVCYHENACCDDNKGKCMKETYGLEHEASTSLFRCMNSTMAGMTEEEYAAFMASEEVQYGKDLVEIYSGSCLIDGVCTVGENCLNCPLDCNGELTGPDDEKYCCYGDYELDLPFGVRADDPRCTCGEANPKDETELRSVTLDDPNFVNTTLKQPFITSGTVSGTMEDGTSVTGTIGDPTSLPDGVYDTGTITGTLGDGSPITCSISGLRFVNGKPTDGIIDTGTLTGATLGDDSTLDATLSECTLVSGKLTDGTITSAEIKGLKIGNSSVTFDGTIERCSLVGSRVSDGLLTGKVRIVRPDGSAEEGMCNKKKFLNGKLLDAKIKRTKVDKNGCNGFVTGGGFTTMTRASYLKRPGCVCESPDGICAECNEIDWRAQSTGNFGFNAKRFRSGNPRGNTNFVLAEHGFHFRTATGKDPDYDGLEVVCNDRKYGFGATVLARWTGIGQVARSDRKKPRKGSWQSGHRFFVSIQDKGEPGNLDTWRLRIMDLDGTSVLLDTNIKRGYVFDIDPFCGSEWDSCDTMPDFDGDELGGESTNEGHSIGGGNVQTHCKGSPPHAPCKPMIPKKEENPIEKFAPPEPTSAPTYDCSPKPLDVCIAIDMSGSVCSPPNKVQSCSGWQSCNSNCKQEGFTDGQCCANFKAEMDFAKSIVNGIDAFESTQKFSLVSFASDSSTHTGLKTAAQVIDEIDALHYTGGWTITSDAIKDCHETLKDSPNARALILITDGTPTKGSPGTAAGYKKAHKTYAQRMAQEAKDTGIRVIPVFISTGDTDVKYMKTLGNSPDDTIHITQFNDLTGTLSQLQQIAECIGAPEEEKTAPHPTEDGPTLPPAPAPAPVEAFGACYKFLWGHTCHNPSYWLKTYDGEPSCAQLPGEYRFENPSNYAACPELTAGGQDWDKLPDAPPSCVRVLSDDCETSRVNKGTTVVEFEIDTTACGLPSYLTESPQKDGTQYGCYFVGPNTAFYDNKKNFGDQKCPKGGKPEEKDTVSGDFLYPSVKYEFPKQRYPLYFTLQVWCGPVDPSTNIGKMPDGSVLTGDPNGVGDPTNLFKDGTAPECPVQSPYVKVIEVPSEGN